MGSAKPAIATYLSVPQVAAKLGVSRTTAYRLVRSRRIPAARPKRGRTAFGWQVKEADLAGIAVPDRRPRLEPVIAAATLSVIAAARRVGISKSKAYRGIKAGFLPVTLLNGWPRVTATDLPVWTQVLKTNFRWKVRG